ncbi:MAG: [protein-PII] uridylyltransferase [Pseudomonadota bacterium]
MDDTRIHGKTAVEAKQEQPTALKSSAAPRELPRAKAVLRRANVMKTLAALRAEHAGGPAERGAILQALRSALRQADEELRRRFEASNHGPETVHARAAMVDSLIRALYDHAADDLYPTANPSSGERLAVVAVGGYGRGELAPYSDLDLLFLYPYKMTARVEQIIEALLYYLWDLGFKVGHATRTVDDSLRLARRDQTIATNLLDARFLWGDQSLFLEFKTRFRSEVMKEEANSFLQAKLTERDERHKKTGDSRYSLEPHIKDGKGGLRDLQSLLWIAKFAHGVSSFQELQDRGLASKREVATFERAESFLWTLRCHLHYCTGRGEERLTFDRQPQIAQRMGYRGSVANKSVERFMKHYFLIAKSVGSLTRLVCADLEAKTTRRLRDRLPALLRRRFDDFQMKAGRLTVEDQKLFREEPIQMLRLFRLAQQHDLEIHPESLRWVTRNLRLIDALRDDPAANKLFLDLLCHAERGEEALARMNECGLLGRFLPDFGRVVSQMQFNMYHHFTVDEHLIRSIGILGRIENGKLAEEAPVATEIFPKILSRRVLYVALLLHDIAKGRPGDHSDVGAEIALKVGPRLGLNAEETETASWLVRQHLKMSDTAFKRDLDDPQTIRGFVEEVQSMERLRLLLVLTVADIRAVGPGVWTAWKASLLRDLYWRAEELLSGGHATEGREARVAAAKEALRAALPDWPASDVEAHIQRGYPSYWLSFDGETHARHAELVRDAEASQAPLTITNRVDRYREVTELTVYTADHPGLFSRIAGALAAAGANIEVAKIFTLANGMALDVFYLHDSQTGEALCKPARLARLATYIEQTLAGAMQPWRDLDQYRAKPSSRLQVFTVTPRVLVDNRASATHTVIEINGRDRPGLLHDVTFALTTTGLIIHNAVITTYGERVVDSFYVQNALNQKVLDRAKLARLKKRLATVIDGKHKRPAKTKRAA